MKKRKGKERKAYGDWQISVIFFIIIFGVLPRFPSYIKNSIQRLQTASMAAQHCCLKLMVAVFSVFYRDTAWKRVLPIASLPPPCWMRVSFSSRVLMLHNFAGKWPYRRFFSQIYHYGFHFKRQTHSAHSR